ncbi:3-oxoacyl-ACP synthase III family protein [Lacrimispora sp. JR3]|uniref:3-oxoacyl-ACP synthase III family protein n=1 Tax=Lacrimispora sinapis TaxID=3111456 RepID=UPI003747CF09
MAYIVNTAQYLPAKEISNSELTQFPPKYRQLIEEKAGIKTRRHVTDECTSDIGALAVKQLLKKTGMDPSGIDALICATSSPDRIQPATATRIQEICGLKNAFCFDLNSVCSGGIYGLKIASALIKDGIKNVIVVAAEVYSRLLNPKDIATYPYFGDGAAAVLVSGHGLYELKDVLLFSDGSGCDVIQIPAGGSMLPAPAVKKERDYYFSMDGQSVYRFACEKGSALIETLAERNVVAADRIITHQANRNIIKEIARRTNLPEETFFINVEKYANTAGASVLIALNEYLESEKANEEDHVFLAAFGGGLSWAGCYLKKENHRE